MKITKLSIVIPTYNEEKDISECLSSLFQQSYDNFEIIIIDDGSTDKTLKIVSSFKKVRILKRDHKGPGLARNLGAKNSKGEILVFVDADMTFHKDYLKNLVKPILNDKTGKIIGSTHELEIVKNIKNIWSRCWGRVKVSKEEARKVNIFRAIRKEKFLELGGFDKKYGYADDQTLWFRYKIKPIVAKNSICYHKNPETLKGVYRQSRWIGASHLYSWIETPILNLICVFIMILISPLMIIFLSIKKNYKNKDFIILPYMIIFMTARYFGNLSGYLERIIKRDNVR